MQSPFIQASFSGHGGVRHAFVVKMQKYPEKRQNFGLKAPSTAAQVKSVSRIWIIGIA